MPEVIVIGAGIAGLSAAVTLADRGADVVCLERGMPGGGQSGGLTRIFRHIHESEQHVRLIASGRAAWEAWEARAGRVLTGREGALYAGADLDDLAGYLAAVGIEHEVVDGEAARSLLPLLAPGADRVLHDPGGGATRVRRTIETLAGWLGPRLVRAEVLGIFPDGDGAIVQSSEGLWRCDRVLVCAGAETAGMARTLGIELPVTLHVHLRATFAVRPEHRGRPLPCWMDVTETFGYQVYASPVGSSGRYVVGNSAPDGDVLVPDGEFVPAPVKLAADLERLRDYVARALPGLEPEPVGTRLCHTTSLPWASDAFAVWEAGPVALFAGHNLFKWAPLLGGWLADAVGGGPIRPELRPRFVP